jgi:hypothetical protein
MSADGRKSKVAEELESDMRLRQESRKQEERSQWEDLNQSIQTGTHDSTFTGVHWGPSFGLRKRKASKPQPEDEKKA